MKLILETKHNKIKIPINPETINADYNGEIIECGEIKENFYKYSSVIDFIKRWQELNSITEQGKIERLPQEFLDLIKEQGATDEQINKLKSLRGITLEKCDIDIQDDTINNNFNFTFDSFEDVNE